MAVRKAPPAGAAPVTLVCGGKAYDAFLAERACAEAVAAAVGEEAGEAVLTLRGDELTWGRLVDEARTGSLFSPRRAIVVRAADALKGEGQEIVDYLGDPAPGVALVLLAPKIDKRRAVWKALSQRARVLAAEPLKGRAVHAFVGEEARRRGLSLEPEAAEELVQRVGQDLRRVVGELDKLQSYLGTRRQVSAEDVAAVLGRGFARPFYKLGDALAERQPAESLTLLRELLDDGEEGVALVVVLHRALRQVRVARALREAGAGRTDLLRGLKLPPPMEFKLEGILKAASRWSDADLAVAFRALLTADRQLKAGAEAGSTLASAVLTACAGRAGAAPPPQGARRAAR